MIIESVLIYFSKKHLLSSGICNSDSVLNTHLAFHIESLIVYYAAISIESSLVFQPRNDNFEYILNYP